MRWRIGDVTVTKIVELEVTGGSRFILPQATPRSDPADRLARPHFADEDGRLRMSIHSLVVETPTRQIVVDTCLGNDKQNRRIPTWNDLHGPFLDDLAAAGIRARRSTPCCAPICTWTMSAGTPCWSMAAGCRRSREARYLIGRVEYSTGRVRRGATTWSRCSANSVAAGLRCRLGRSGGDRRTGLRRDRPDSDDRPYAGPRQRAHPLARRGGADHRRLHAPPVSDRASGVGFDSLRRSGEGAADAAADVRGAGRIAGAGDRHALRRCDSGMDRCQMGRPIVWMCKVPSLRGAKRRSNLNDGTRPIRWRLPRRFAPRNEIGHGTAAFV